MPFNDFEAAMNGAAPEEYAGGQVDRLGLYYRDILAKVRAGEIDVESALKAMTDSGYMDSGWNNRPGEVERQRSWLDFAHRGGLLQRQWGR